MADCPFGPEQFRDIREFLEDVLQSLDEAELHLAALHIDTALKMLIKEQTFRTGTVCDLPDLTEPPGFGRKLR